MEMELGPSSSDSQAQDLLALLDRLPVDLVAQHIWSRLSRRCRGRLRASCRGMARLGARELMSHLQVLCCRASLQQLLSSSTRLHDRFPHPSSVMLRLLPPPPRGAAGAAPDDAAAAAAAGGAVADGWYGTTAVLSYFLSELGACGSVTALALQGWQELSARNLHHIAAAYPRLARLHLSGLPSNNYLTGSSLEPLGGCGSLTEVVIDTQVVLDLPAALAALAALPALRAASLSACPLLSGVPLPLPALSRLTRLSLTFEHRHTSADAALCGLSALTGLRDLGLDFQQLGPSSSLWSAGPLLASALSRLTALSRLALPRAFLYDSTHPACLAQLGRMPYLADLALGSVILSPETAAAAAAGRLVGKEAGAGAGSGAGRGDVAAEAGPSAKGGEGEGGLGSDTVRALARPWRRLALGAAMPCYVEALLGALGIVGLGAEPKPVTHGSQSDAPAAAATPSPASPSARPSLPTTPSRAPSLAAATPSPASAGAASARSPCPPALSRQNGAHRGGGGGGGGGGAPRGSLHLLELCSPAPLPLAQLLPGLCAGPGRAGGVREVRLLVRLAASWQEVLTCLSRVPALSALALQPTYLYGSGTLMPTQVLTRVASLLSPHLAHLEMYRLAPDVGPAEVAELAAMPRLSYVLLDVADEARERGGQGHPAALVRGLLAALRRRRQRGHRRAHAPAAPAGRGGTPGGAVSKAAGAAGGQAEAGGAGRAGHCAAATACGGEAGGGEGRGVAGLGGEEECAWWRHGYASDGDGGGGGLAHGGAGEEGEEVVVCCPQLSEEEVAAMNEEEAERRRCGSESGGWHYGCERGSSARGDSGGGGCAGVLRAGVRLRVEREAEWALPRRLALGCGMAPGRWRP